MNTAKRLEGIGEYYFSQKLREIDELNKQGKNIINLGIGNPDLPPHPDVIKTLQEESEKPGNHAYQSYKGSPVLRKAISNWYRQYYNVTLDADTEILPLIGSKEGIVHICMTYLNEGDLVLIPNPGYPTYRNAVKLAGGKVVEYHLKAENNWYPDFEELEQIIISSKSEAGVLVASPNGGSRSERTPLEEEGAGALLFLNYPHMPTGQLSNEDLFKQLVLWAKKNNVLIVHDNPYSFILNEKPMSLLAVEGAKEVVIELNSVSKSHNMAGWRVGMLCGAKKRIDEVLQFKSNMDSGMFLPVQLAAAKALSLSADWYKQLNAVYLKRRTMLFELLDLLGCSYSTTQAGLFVWAKVPEKYDDGYKLSDDLLYKANIFLTPGGIFGSEGEKFIRVSLCCTEENIEEAIKQIKNNF